MITCLTKECNGTSVPRLRRTLEARGYDFLSIPQLKFQSAVFKAVKLPCVVKQELTFTIVTSYRSFSTSYPVGFHIRFKHCSFHACIYSSRRKIITSPKSNQKQSLIALIALCFRDLNTLGVPYS